MNRPVLSLASLALATVALLTSNDALAGPTVKKTTWWTEVGHLDVVTNRWFGGYALGYLNRNPVQCPEGQESLLTGLQVTPASGVLSPGDFPAGEEAFDRLGPWSVRYRHYTFNGISFEFTLRSRGSATATGTFEGGLHAETFLTPGEQRRLDPRFEIRTPPDPEFDRAARSFRRIRFDYVATFACGDSTQLRAGVPQ